MTRVQLAVLSAEKAAVTFRQIITATAIAAAAATAGISTRARMKLISAILGLLKIKLASARTFAKRHHVRRL